MPTTTEQSDPPEWMLPYMQDYLGRAQDVANNPYVQSPGTFTPANDTLQAGWQATANRAINGSPEMGAASQGLQSFYSQPQQGAARNPYASAQNPYLSEQIGYAQGDLTKAWNNTTAPQFDKMMSNSGSFGNSGVSQYAGLAAQGLQQNLGRVSSDMRSSAYNKAADMSEAYAGRSDSMYGQNQNRMLNAYGMAPAFAANDYNDANALLGVGQQMQGFNQAATNQNNKWWEESQGFAQNQLNNYGGALGINTGTTSSTSTPNPSTASQVVGGAIAGSQLLPWWMSGGA